MMKAQRIGAAESPDDFNRRKFASVEDVAIDVRDFAHIFYLGKRKVAPQFCGVVLCELLGPERIAERLIGNGTSRCQPSRR